MTVTGDTCKLTEKVECVVCGRDGFPRLDETPRRILHPYSPPCELPPRWAPTPPAKKRMTTLEYVRSRTAYPAA